jgi:outer membrane protein OmpA-like peptidoglycan-associated protein
MRGAVVVLAAAGLLAGCASSKVSLYSDADGGAGAVAVFDAKTDGEVGALTEPNTWAQLGGKTITPRPIKTPHTDLLARMPPPPRSYVLYFLEGKTDLAPGSEEMLAALRQAVTAVSDVQIVGHTDTVGSSADNDALSRERAAEVRAALVKQGLPLDNAKVTGRGERELRIKTADGVDEPGNRRVEVIVR